jgi:N-acetylglucosaminyldiphosphoundecaprenol N-acetyl-beta-D-mannosaminyltransferase
MKILNVRVDSINYQEAIAALETRQVIFTPNPEIILEARRNKSFRRALKKGSMMLPDGHGLLFVSTLMKVKAKFNSKFLCMLLYFPALLLFLIWKKPFKTVLPGVIHGSDFMALVVAWAEMNKKSVFFLGAGDGVAKETSEYFQSQHKDLKVAGYSALDPSYKAFELVKKSGAEVLFVAYGAPKQEMWIAKYAQKLPKLDTVMGVGGSFNFWSGRMQRAPIWMRRIGLEWLYRLYLEPKVRLKRIWNALVKFPLTCLFSS